MWPWWVRFPTEDFTDVTLVSDDIDDPVITPDDDDDLVIKNT